MSQSFEQGAEMSKDVNELIMSWQSQGYDPVVCTYSILLRFTAIAAGMIEGWPTRWIYPPIGETKAPFRTLSGLPSASELRSSYDCHQG